MIISDSYKKRVGKGSDANEMLASYLLDKFVKNNLIVGNRSFGLPDCYTTDYKIGFEIARVGFLYDFMKESVIFDLTNASFDDLDKTFENETLRNATNYNYIIKEKFKKLNSGNYNQISKGCHLVAYDFDRHENEERINKLIDIYEHFSNKYPTKFLSFFIITSSSIKNYGCGDLKTIVEFSTNKLNDLIKQFKTIYNKL